MKKVSGFRYRVSSIGFRMRTLPVLILLAFSTFASPGFGYDMKYKFKKGQVLKYQYDTEIIETSSGKNDHLIFPSSTPNIWESIL